LNDNVSFSDFIFVLANNTSSSSKVLKITTDQVVVSNNSCALQIYYSYQEYYGRGAREKLCPGLFIERGDRREDVRMRKTDETNLREILKTM